MSWWRNVDLRIANKLDLGDEMARDRRWAKIYIGYVIFVAIFIIIGAKYTVGFNANQKLADIMDPIGGLLIIGLFAGPAIYAILEDVRKDRRE